MGSYRVCGLSKALHNTLGHCLCLWCHVQKRTMWIMGWRPAVLFRMKIQFSCGAKLVSRQRNPSPFRSLCITSGNSEWFAAPRQTNSGRDYPTKGASFNGKRHNMAQDNGSHSNTCTRWGLLYSITYSREPRTASAVGFWNWPSPLPLVPQLRNSVAPSALNTHTRWLV